jgi:nitroimidazol reductase NimA-like FMN-containing flavoprotein (pyridoxamine 5'-phosphate oxidase superfamily)
MGAPKHVRVGSRQPGVSVLTALTPPECTTLLAENHVGRIAFADRAHVDIVPICYVFVDGWLYARADAPMRLAIRRNRWVAVEVAEVTDIRNWKSVVVRGACHPVRGTGSIKTDAAAAIGVDLLRASVPVIATARSSTIRSTTIYRIHADHVTGLKAASGRDLRLRISR